MVNAKEAALGKYIKPEHIENSDNKVAVIISEGQYTEGKFGRKLEIDINFNKIKQVWSVNSASSQNLIDGYGEDTGDWIGKKVEFEVEESGDKKRIVGYPVKDEVKTQ